ncbi:MAG TPA: PPOX class F420-dependent oxidoreductase [Anaerolineales bacterium]|nr:PPOX class F420-dependent oxidoreductase [Anaerolineales bacterium]
MQTMTAEEARAFLLRGQHTGKLATVRPDGSPHVVPVWYILDGDDILFTTWHASVKAANLLANPRAALCVDDETMPYAFVLVEGVASITKEAPDMLHWTTRIAERYVCADQADAYGARNAVPGEWLVRLIPEKTVAQKGIAD